MVWTMSTQNDPTGRTYTNRYGRQTSSSGNGGGFGLPGSWRTDYGQQGYQRGNSYSPTGGRQLTATGALPGYQPFQGHGAQAGGQVMGHQGMSPSQGPMQTTGLPTLGGTGGVPGGGLWDMTGQGGMPTMGGTGGLPRHPLLGAIAGGGGLSGPTLGGTGGVPRPMGGGPQPMQQPQAPQYQPPQQQQGGIGTQDLMSLFNSPQALNGGMQPQGQTFPNDPNSLASFPQIEQSASQPPWMRGQRASYQRDEHGNLVPYYPGGTNQETGEQIQLTQRDLMERHQQQQQQQQDAAQQATVTAPQQPQQGGGSLLDNLFGNLPGGQLPGMGGAPGGGTPGTGTPGSGALTNVGTPQIPLGPIVTPQQQNQILNSILGGNIQQEQGGRLNAQRDMAARGFSGGSPALQSTMNRLGLNRALADTQARSQVPLDVARTNADYGLEAMKGNIGQRAQDINAWSAVQNAITGRIGSTLSPLLSALVNLS